MINSSPEIDRIVRCVRVDPIRCCSPLLPQREPHSWQSSMLSRTPLVQSLSEAIVVGLLLIFEEPSHGQS